MQYFEQQVGPNGAKLAAYLHSVETELASAARRPAVLVCPGGGYAMCSAREAEPIALAYMAEGFQAFVLHYTVGRGQPGVADKALQDAEAALELLRSREAEWNILPGQIAAVGFSAGGHLAAALGTMGRVKPDAMVLGYPSLSKHMLEQLDCDGTGLMDKVTGETPPSFLFHTRTDKLVPVSNSLEFAAALDAADIPFELHIFREGGHGLSLAKALTANGLEKMTNPAVAQWFGLSVAWLRATLGDFPVGQAYEAMRGTIYLGLLKTPLGNLRQREDMWPDIERELPALTQLASAFEGAMNLSIEKLMSYAPEAVPAEALQRLQERFAE